jgi:hypothetical protein
LSWFRATPRAPAIRVAVVVSLAACVLLTLASVPAVASSHREAPLTSADPQIDGTDVYAFVSPDKPSTVTLISNWIPFETPAGGPNFYSFAPGVHYDIKIDNSGTAKPDIIYRWIFTNHFRSTNTFLYNTGPVTSLTDKTLNFFQTYDLQRITSSGTRTLLHDALVAPSNVGKASMPNYPALQREAIFQLPDGGQTLAGQSDDPFFLDLRVFDLIYGPNFVETGQDSLAGFNVNTLVLQVPKSDLVGDHGPIIGVWSTAERDSVRTQTSTGGQSFSGEPVQVSRLGNPLVNEVVIPVGQKDRFNASRVSDDAQFLPFVTDPELPKVIQATHGIPAPPTPRNDLVAVFLTGLKGLNMPANVTPGEELRLNTSIAPTAPVNGGNRLGVIAGDNAGFPNGRRLADDVLDIELRVVEGQLIGRPNQLGDRVDTNDVPFVNHFPYLALPHSGSGAGPRLPSGGVATGGGGTAGSSNASALKSLPVSAGFGGLTLALTGLVVRRRRRAKG